MGTKISDLRPKRISGPSLALLSELLWTQAEVCVSTSVSKQLEEQWQKQDGSAPAAFNCDSAAICGCVCLCMWRYNHLVLCVCCAAAWVWNNRTWAHTHTHYGGSEDSCIPGPRLPSCATHTKVWPEEIVTVTTFITVKYISLVLNTLEVCKWVKATL